MKTTLLLLGAVLCTAFAQTNEKALELGRAALKQFQNDEHEALWARISPEMQTALGGSVAGLERVKQSFAAQVGEETELLKEIGQPLTSGWAYTRRARYSKINLEMDFVWQFDAEAVVLGFSLTPSKKEYSSPFLEYQTKTELRLPFDDQWHVFWGGRSLPQNYHAAYQDQRFAYDLLIMKDGKTHTGDGKRNEDYYCFGRPLVAPAAGVVVAAASDIVDNPPGKLNPEQALGNHVIIDHENGEFSFMAHFKQGSVRVKAGDRVQAGDPLGLAGNSGNTTEPHLHYHLQTTAIFGKGEGLPTQFLDYYANDELVARGEPVKGQEIRPKLPQDD